MCSSKTADTNIRERMKRKARRGLTHTHTSVKYSRGHCQIQVLVTCFDIITTAVMKWILVLTTIYLFLQLHH